MDTKKLRQKILDLAIRGKLVLQDPNDEPASVLIEKIRAKKKRLIEENKIKQDKNESYIYRSDKSYYEKFADGTVKCIDVEIPFEIPESWEWVRLADICSVITDGTHQTPTYSNDGYIFLSSKNVTTGKIDWENVMYIPESLHEQLYARLAPQRGDILLAKNGTTGFSAVVDRDCVFDIYVSLALLRTFQNEIDPYYLRHIMSSSFVQEQFKANLKGIGVPNLHLENIRNTYIPICSMKEQSRILTKIDSLAAYIDKIEHEKGELASAIKLTKQKILSLAIQGKLLPQDPNDEPAFVLLERIKAEHPKSNKKASKTSDNSHYENLPQGWIECTLGNIGSWSSGATPSRSNKMYYTNGTVNWLKTGDLNDSYVDCISEKITDLALKECSVRLNPKDSVLIAMYGSTIGKIGILTTPSTTNQACCACITYSGTYNKFLFYLLMSQKEILQMKAEGGAQPNISKEKIVNFSILLPPTQEQVRIVQAIDTLFIILDGIVEDL